VLTLVIRNLREDELKHVRQLLSQIFRENSLPSEDTILEKYQKYPSFFIGCFHEKELIGTVFGWPEPDILVVKALAVVKSHRRKRIGTKLLKSFEKAAMKEGFESIVLGARWEAVPFYLHYGLDCFANVQVTPEKFPWNDIPRLRSKYNIISAAIFGPSSSSLISQLNQALKVKVNLVKSDSGSISIQIRPEKISKEGLKEMKREFNAFSTQFAFKKIIRRQNEGE
jgi:N-acetylglutamate synthase-like GNAT family acetyltransferase